MSNAPREGESTDTFGRSTFGGELEPPYATVRVTGALFHTQGGLMVDPDARVLTPSLEAISGLYAAGGAAVGMSGDGASGYLAGNGLLSALGLGYLAGRHAAGVPIG
jgi:fumarate reductase flavoprotein subunit